MNLITYEGLAMIDTNSKIVQLHRVTELHEHCTPTNSKGMWADFKAFWLPEYINPHGVILLALMAIAAVLVIVISSMLIGWGYEELKRIDWHSVGQLMGVMR
jgi:hypothetical protein